MKLRFWVYNCEKMSPLMNLYCSIVVCVCARECRDKSVNEGERKQPACSQIRNIIDQIHGSVLKINASEIDNAISRTGSDITRNIIRKISSLSCSEMH